MSALTGLNGGGDGGGIVSGGGGGGNGFLRTTSWQALKGTRRCHLQATHVAYRLQLHGARKEYVLTLQGVEELPGVTGARADKDWSMERL